MAQCKVRGDIVQNLKNMNLYAQGTWKNGKYMDGDLTNLVWTDSQGMTGVFNGNIKGSHAIVARFPNPEP